MDGQTSGWGVIVIVITLKGLHLFLGSKQLESIPLYNSDFKGPKHKRIRNPRNKVKTKKEKVMWLTRLTRLCYAF